MNMRADSHEPNQDYHAADRHEAQDAEVAARALLSSVDRAAHAPAPTVPATRIKPVSNSGQASCFPSADMASP